MEQTYYLALNWALIVVAAVATLAALASVTWARSVLASTRIKTSAALSSRDMYSQECLRLGMHLRSADTELIEANAMIQELLDEQRAANITAHGPGHVESVTERTPVRVEAEEGTFGTPTAVQLGRRVDTEA